MKRNKKLTQCMQTADEFIRIEMKGNVTVVLHQYGNS